MLSDKKKAFAQGILRGLSNRDAAIHAGYAEKSASQQGSRLAKDPAIEKYISRLRDVNENVKEVPDEIIADSIPIGTTDGVRNHRSKKDPLEFLLNVMSDGGEDPKLRIEAAKAALPYVHSKKGDVGVKQSREDNAEELSKGGGTGRFSAGAPPSAKIN